MIKYLSILLAAAVSIATADTLRTVTADGFIYVSERGNERLKPLPDTVTIPSDATDVTWAADTRTLSWTVPPVDEESEPTTGSYTITAAQIAAADAWTPPVSVPDRVTQRQFRLALLAAEIDVDSLIAAMPDSTAAESKAKAAADIEWNYANYVYRNNALVAQIAAVLSMSTDQVDDIFRAAGAISN